MFQLIQPFSRYLNSVEGLDNLHYFIYNRNKNLSSNNESKYIHKTNVKKMCYDDGPSLKLAYE